MLSFLLNSTMMLVALSFIGLMMVVRRHRKHAKITAWLAFLCALIAGSALALTVFGDLMVGLIRMVAAVLGLPSGAIGAVALLVVVAIVLDLMDQRPDGAARTLALVAPALLLATGGQLGLIGAEVAGAASGAGESLLTSLIGGVG